MLQKYKKSRNPKTFKTQTHTPRLSSHGSQIRNHIIAEAKMLLHIRHDLSVQAIADMLGFGEQASFSRYFKRETGLSPNEFRELE